MTFQALVFLFKIQKAQMRPDNEVYINYQTGTVKAIVDKGEKAKAITIKRLLKNVPDIVEYLRDNGYLNANENLNVIHLVQKGYYYKQNEIWIVLSFLLRSIFVPIVVAAITAYITVMITVRLGAG